MISIIIPVFNNEGTIRRTLESLVSQSYEDYEVIVVNDGSTDGSEKIIQEYSNNDNRFIYLEQKNSGVAAARNKGLEAATHKYIMFVDGDDTLPKDALKSMHQIAVINDADTIIGIMKKVSGTRKHNINCTLSLTSKALSVSRDDRDIINSWSLCNKWFSRDIIEKNNIRFEGYRHLEDVLFLYTYLVYANNIYTCPHAVYTYIKPLPVLGRTTTQKIDPELLRSAVDAFDKVRNITCDFGEDFQRHLLTRFIDATIIGDYYRRLWKLDEKTADWLAEYIEECILKLDYENVDYLRQRHFDLLDSNNRLKRKSALEEYPIIDIVLTSKIPHGAALVIMEGLYDQTEVAFRVIADEVYKDELLYTFEFADNIVWTKSSEIEEELRRSPSKYIIMIDEYMLLNHSSLYVMIRELENDPDKTIVSSSYDYYDGQSIIRSELIEYSHANRASSLNVLFANKVIRKKGEVIDDINSGFDAVVLLDKYGYSVTDRHRMLVCTDEAEILSRIKPSSEKREYLNKKAREKRTAVLGSIRKRAGRVLRHFKRKKTKDSKPQKPKKISAEQCFLDLEVCKGTVVVEGLGKRPKGSSLYLLRALTSGRYGNLDIICPVKKDTEALTKAIIEREGFDGVRTILIGTNEYRKTLFSAEYLFNEVTFPVWWVKKPGQIYTNLWHGTPLKGLGNKKSGAIHDDASAPHNFTSADFFLLPSDYAMEHILGDTDTLNLMCGKGLMLGYPRTGILFDEPMRYRVRSNQGIGKIKVFAWMPTWNDSINKEGILSFLDEINESLDDSQVLYVNLHHRTGIDLGDHSFAHIKAFPQNMDTYEFLTAADVLITDYSSILFDFAVTQRKIILHCPDMEEYKAARGLYLDPRDLPFPVTFSTADLISEMSKPKAYDESEFLNTFNSYDHADNAERLCDIVMLGKTDRAEIKEFPLKNDVNFVVFDAFDDGLIVDWLFDLYDMGRLNGDTYISFNVETADRNIDRIDPLLRHVKVFPTKGKAWTTITERKRLYGDIKISKFALIDPADSHRITSFSSFTEPVSMLLTEKQISLIKEGDANMKKAVIRFARYGNGIYTVTDDDSDYLQSEMGITAETVNSAENFYRTFIR